VIEIRGKHHVQHPHRPDQIVEEEPHIVAALYACAFSCHRELRGDDRGKPLSRSFVEGKIMNLKENPYKSHETNVLRGLFTDLRMKMGGKNEYQRPCRQIFHALRGPSLALEDGENEIEETWDVDKTEIATA